MRGYPRFNFDAFDHARDVINGMGHTAVSPADLDRAAKMDLVTPNVSPADLRACITRDIHAVMDCDGLVLLNGWGKSKGVAVEKALAEFLSIPLYSFINDQLVRMEY